jgi:hypothetical protein
MRDDVVGGQRSRAEALDRTRKPFAVPASRFSLIASSSLSLFHSRSGRPEPVAFLGVELDGGAAHVALGIGRSERRRRWRNAGSRR